MTGTVITKLFYHQKIKHMRNTPNSQAFQIFPSFISFPFLENLSSYIFLLNKWAFYFPPISTNNNRIPENTVFDRLGSTSLFIH